MIFKFNYVNECYVDIWYVYSNPNCISKLVTPKKCLIKPKIEVEEPNAQGGEFIICVELIDKDSFVEIGTCSICSNKKTYTFVNYPLAEQLFKMIEKKPGVYSNEYINAASVPDYIITSINGPSLKRLYTDSKTNPLLPSISDIYKVQKYIERKWTWLQEYEFNESYDNLIVNRMYPDQVFGSIPTCMSYYKVLDRLPRNFHIVPEQALKFANNFLPDKQFSDEHLLYLIIYFVSRVIQGYVKYKEDEISNTPVDVYSCDAFEYGTGDCEDMAYIAYGCFKLIKSDKLVIPARLKKAVELLDNYSVGCILLYATNYHQNLKESLVKRIDEKHFYHMSCCLMPKVQGQVPLFCDGTISFYPNMFESFESGIVSEMEALLPDYFDILDMKVTGNNTPKAAFVYEKAFVFYSDEVPGYELTHTTFLIGDGANKIGVVVEDMDKMKFELIPDTKEDLTEMIKVITPFIRCHKPIVIEKKAIPTGNLKIIAAKMLNQV